MTYNVFSGTGALNPTQSIQPLCPACFRLLKQVNELIWVGKFSYVLTHLCEVTYGKTERNTPYRITIIRVPGRKNCVLEVMQVQKPYSSWAIVQAHSSSLTMHADLQAEV